MDDLSPKPSSWKALAEILAAKIASGEWPEGMRIASGNALAKELGVDRNAAHRAVEELQRRGLVQRRAGSGSIVTPRSEPSLRKVALLMDIMAPNLNYPSTDLLRGLQDRLGERTHLVVAQSKQDRDVELRQLDILSREMDGIVFYPITGDHATPRMRALRERGYPIVAIDRTPLDAEIDAVYTADQEAAHHAVRVLIEHGHRRIAFLSFKHPYLRAVSERFEGYRQALREAGIEFTEENVRWFPRECNRDMPVYRQLVRDAVYALTQRAEGVTAMFCVEDGVALPVVESLTGLGWQVSKDVDVATFSDWSAQALDRPWNLHRLVQRKYEIGQAAADLILKRLVDRFRPPEVVRVEADFLAAGAGLAEMPLSSGQS